MPPVVSVGFQPRDAIPPSSFPFSRLTHRRSYQDGLGMATGASTNPLSFHRVPSGSVRRRNDEEENTVANAYGSIALLYASLGCKVSASDISPPLIDRLKKEARLRSLQIESQVIDIRHLSKSNFPSMQNHAGFDVALCLGDSIPHLLTRGDVISAFSNLLESLREGGVAMVSFTDRSNAQKSDTGMKACGVRPDPEVPGKRWMVWQVWDWVRPQRKQGRVHQGGNVGSWFGKGDGGVVGMVTGGLLGSHPQHLVDGLPNPATGVSGDEEGGDEDAGMSKEDLDDQDDWLPQDDDPMGWREPEVRDEAWLAPNGIAPGKDRGSLGGARLRPTSMNGSPNPSATSSLNSGSSETTISIPMVDLQVNLYDLSLYFLEDDGTSVSTTAKVMRTRCRAWRETEIMDLLREVGFVHVGKAEDGAFCQPLVYGYKPREKAVVGGGEI
ncbi:hypothetical protein HDU97_005476 [Phlyctochytrium planicorne]|nr:hypothetical protein HDU97_005476 [Phlyctochytrium planicorne]